MKPKYVVAPLRSALLMLKLRNDDLLAEVILTDSYLNLPFPNPWQEIWHDILQCSSTTFDLLPSSSWSQRRQSGQRHLQLLPSPMDSNNLIAVMLILPRH